MGGVGVQDVWGREMLHRAAFFYAYCGLVASVDPFWLQGAVDTPTRLFNRVGLRKNVRKTVMMLYCPLHAVGSQL